MNPHQAKMIAIYKVRNGNYEFPFLINLIPNTSFHFFYPSSGGRPSSSPLLTLAFPLIARRTIR